MLYIVEGADRSGKTTFTKEFARRTGSSYQKYSKPPEGTRVWDYFYPAINNASKGESIVCDRHMVGEKVYAAVKKEKSRWEETEYEDMLELLQTLHASIIFVWEYPSVIKKRILELGDDYVSGTESVKAQNLFRKEIKRISKEYPGITVLSYHPTSNVLRFMNPITP